MLSCFCFVNSMHVTWVVSSWRNDWLAQRILMYIGYNQLNDHDETYLDTAISVSISNLFLPMDGNYTLAFQLHPHSCKLLIIRTTATWAFGYLEIPVQSDVNSSLRISKQCKANPWDKEGAIYREWCFRNTISWFP